MPDKSAVAADAVDQQFLFQSGQGVAESDLTDAEFDGKGGLGRKLETGSVFAGENIGAKLLVNTVFLEY